MSKNYQLTGQANKDEKEMQITQEQVKFHPNLEENTNCFSRRFFTYTRHIMQKGARLERNKEYLTQKDLYDCRKELHPNTQQKLLNETVFNEEYVKSLPKNSQGSSNLYTKSMKNILGNDYIYAAVIGTLGNLLQFAGPVFLKKIMEYLEDEEAEEYEGYIWASGILLCFFTKIFITQNCLDLVNSYSLKLQNGTSGILIEKIFRLSSAAKKYFEPGKIMNFITVDQNQVFQMGQVFAMMASSPIMIIVALALICVELGWWGLLTPVFLIIAFMIQAVLQTKLGKLRDGVLHWKDKRAKAVYEYINGIRIVKYYAWEKVVEDQVQQMRKNESQKLKKFSIIRTSIEETSNFTPVLVSICIFIIYVAAGNKLAPSKAYTVLALFNLLVLPFRMMIFTLMMYVGTKVSVKRIDHFMDADEKKNDTLIEDQNIAQGTIKIENGDFAWETVDALIHDLKKPGAQNNKKKNNQKGQIDAEENSAPEDPVEALKQKDLSIISDINFEAKKGELHAIVGMVASGKTSFLHALLGEMNVIKGKTSKNGSIAYISQSAWLQNETLRNNILFGQPYDERRYKHTLKICELQSDIDILPGGDQVEIGERGVNLSGGQKQRIQIARALYADKDIYLIDDCLSALDGHVGKNIFNNVIKTALRDKTVIFVTHALQYMPETDYITVFSKGKIVEQGQYPQLIAKKDSEFEKLTVQLKKEEEEEEDEEEELQQVNIQSDHGIDGEDIPDEKNPKYLPPINAVQKQQSKDQSEQLEASMSSVSRKSRKNSTSIGLKKNQSSMRESKIMQKQLEEKKKQEQGALVHKEERAVGSVPLKIYFNYMSSGGVCMTISVFFSLILAQCSKIANDWWLGQWANDKYDLSDSEYIGYYALFGVCIAIFFFIRGQIFAVFTIKSADNFQKRLMNKLLHTPMYWFDITPTGRIISRTTKDQDDIDSLLPFSLSVAIQYTLLLLSTIILIGVILPLFFAVSIIALIVFVKIVGYYLISAREIKRIETNARSPVISNFQELINGTYIIRAFNKQQFYIEKYLSLQHKFLVSCTNYNYTQRWISVMTDLFAVIIISSTAYFSVLSKTQNYLKDPSLMGLAISYSFQIMIVLSFTLKMVADTESQMNALVRMLQYIEGNPEERDWDTPVEKAQSDANTTANNSQVWPTEGGYKLDKVTYKYREELPEVIHGISFDIKPCEKIGIVGRTGSGKSTMTLGLLRILEMSQDGQGILGNINLDGVDISKVGLHVLREKVTIIPQDPVLFTGTLKFNVDPFDKFPRKALIESLKQVHIWDQIQEMADKQEQDNENNQLQQRLSEQEKEDRVLNWMVDDGGENFSLGQRQLICMARALIRKPKVLLMDEATASIDEKTDHLIQRMIKNAFKGTTVITIAHRINTIMQYDKIVVLDQGNIIELDTPINLINKETGIFASLVNEGGKEFKEKMIYLAQNKDVDVETL